MSKNRIPTLAESYELLCRYGEQFPAPRSLMTLETGDLIDPEVLAAQGMVYTGRIALREALEQHDIASSDFSAAIRLVEHQFQKDALIWGFSGYASGGYEYEYTYGTEAKALSILYAHLISTGRKPGMAIDGGVSAGNLGLSGVIAARNGVPTIGTVPFKGMKAAGVRNHLWVWGNTYEEREKIVGTLPDVVVALGGGDGTKRECLAALDLGSRVLLLALKNYDAKSLPATYLQEEKMREAVEVKHTMVVCKSMKDIPRCIDMLLDEDVGSNRPPRLDILRTLLV